MPAKSRLHSEILSSAQRDLLPLVKQFFRHFGLVGGTAIALHFGHRQSIDFDLFSNRAFDNGDIRKIITKTEHIEQVALDERGQYTVIARGVRFTFIEYPFKLSFPYSFDGFIKLPDILTLAAMKAYALGRRAKWKDYVDMYFIIKRYGSLARVTARAHKIFGAEFNEKLFRTQLAYFEDIDFSEEIMYLPGFETSQEEIKSALTKFSLE